ncbi:MAG TPA: WbqC family protein [Cyclobacteriaceae bacterium]|nr:WbqC family protein [Cyclobacteriaceae bacterium]
MQKIKHPTPDSLSVVVLDLQYMPPLPYFLILMRARQVILDIHEHYVKQSYRNRCRILTPNGTLDLVVPLSKPRQHIPMENIRIDNNQNWARIHWKAIQSAYGKSPWFLHYASPIHDLIMEKNIYLKDLNLKILKYFLEVLGIHTDPVFTEKYDKTLHENCTDLRSAIHPKKTDTGLTFYQPVPYGQNFGVNFVSSLSIIDLVFNEGPESREIIFKSYFA